MFKMKKSSATRAFACLLILFMLLRMAMNKKAAEGTRTLMKWLDGIGFGLLPADRPLVVTARQRLYPTMFFSTILKKISIFAP